MNCLKCGKEYDSDRVFCQECLQVMQEHPIPADTPVMILPRPPMVADKNKRKSDTPEKVIAGLKRKISRMGWVILIEFTLIACLGATLYYFLWLAK